jgi:hypothetical protein
MTRFHFATYGVIHAGDEIEAKCFLQEAIKESDGQFEHLNIIVEEDDS